MIFLSFPRVHFWGAIGGGVPMTGNIPRRGSGLSCRLSQPEAGSLTRFTASIIIKPLMLHRKGDRTRRLFILRGIGVTPLYATVTRLEPSFNTTARPPAPWCCHFSEVGIFSPLSGIEPEAVLCLCPLNPIERDISCIDYPKITIQYRLHIRGFLCFGLL